MHEARIYLGDTCTKAGEFPLQGNCDGFDSLCLHDMKYARPNCSYLESVDYLRTGCGHGALSFGGGDIRFTGVTAVEGVVGLMNSTVFRGGFCDECGEFFAPGHPVLDALLWSPVSPKVFRTRRGLKRGWWKEYPGAIDRPLWRNGKRGPLKLGFRNGMWVRIPPEAP